jgi:protein-tyrosine phosphatase
MKEVTRGVAYDAPDEDTRPFAHVRPRRNVDELLRNVQQALVAYTGQADLKANIVITTSSLVLTIVATRWSEHSLRPAGGYATRDGHWVRTQQLYRAGGPHALTQEDVVKLRALELATVIDLRTPHEVHERGCYVTVLADVVEYHLPMTDVLPDSDELPRWTDPQVVAVEYRNMLERGTHTIAEVLAIVTDPSAYPVMFHCSAGKDRTGVLSAVLLGVLGVPDETIITDYALSRGAMERLIEYYQVAYPDAGERLSRLAPAMVAAYPEAMAAFLDGVHRDYGTFDDYTTAIGVGSSSRHIRNAVLT